MTARTPDGMRIAIVRLEGGRGQSHEVSVWSLESAQRLITLPVPGRPLHVTFSADGNRLLIAHEGTGGVLSMTTLDATPVEN
jgi:Tol biopolymer transport system component